MKKFVFFCFELELKREIQGEISVIPIGGNQQE